ncbi:hypothetical protein E4O00_06475 [Treponema sp. OMZ 788]|uniref:hypothetical protein n=1 Tax=Treponema sp. OMZ 788 TaxID=2563664 RepID=UPI0020A2DC7B|nr:hypothetical protein [Treponema sp. OMZ 788]UTC65701.1 hypothetical protein E4O00_06475 [Treponema sp. OMZ 788]
MKQRKVVSMIGALVVIISVVAFITGCQQANSNTINSSIRKDVSFIDIVDAKALLVIPENNYMNRSITSNKKFAKMLSDGSIYEVKVKNSNGDELEVASPSQIYDVNAKYVILIIENNPYLVSKIDGSAFDLSPMGSPEMLRANAGYKGELRESIFSDKSNNIYYLNGGVVKKIDVSDPNVITGKKITPDIYSISCVDEFVVDNDGNVFFSYDDRGNGSLSYAKIRTANNALKNIFTGSYSGDHITIAFRGLDGNIYFASREGAFKVLIDTQSNIKFEDYNVSGVSMGSQYMHWLYFPDRISVIFDGKKYEVFNKSGVCSKSENLEFLKTGIFKLLAYNAHNYYVVTTDGRILRVDLDTDNPTVLLNNSDYEFYKIEVTDNNLIIFNGLRLSDSKKVLGTISVDGNVTILDDALSDNNAIVLKRIK